LLRGFDLSDRLLIWKHVRFAEALWHIASDPEAVEVLLDIFAGDPDRSGGVDEALGRIGTSSPAVLPALLDALRAEERNYSTAVSAVEEIGPPAHEAVPFLTKALASEGAWCRMPAARALWRITGEAGASVAALVAALDDPNERVGRWAACCLGRMGPAAAAALPALRRKLDEAEGEYKESCLRPVPRKLLFVEAVGVIEGRLPAWRLEFTGDLKLLLDELDGPDASHRRWAAEFLGQMGPEAWTAIPALRRELARAEGEYVDLLGVRRPAREPFQRALAAINEAMGESDDVAS
jgi:HEAT repeat protein